MRPTSARIQRPTIGGRSNTGVGGIAQAEPQFHPYGRTLMRPLIALVILASTSSAQAQYPWGYPQYRPSYPLYGGPYAPPAQRLSPVSLSQSMLAAHNAVRSRVGVPSLVWSDQLAEVAQDWANHLIATGSFSHRPDNSYGENLYSISGGTASPAQVVSY